MRFISYNDTVHERLDRGLGLNLFSLPAPFQLPTPDFSPFHQLLMMVGSTGLGNVLQVQLVSECQLPKCQHEA